MNFIDSLEFQLLIFSLFSVFHHLLSVYCELSERMFRILIGFCLVFGYFCEVSSRYKRNNEFQCGEPSKFVGYISGGIEVKRGQYPW